LVQGEGVEDAILDIINYSVLAYGMIQEGGNESHAIGEEALSIAGAQADKAWKEIELEIKEGVAKGKSFDAMPSDAHGVWKSFEYVNQAIAEKLAEIKKAS